MTVDFSSEIMEGRKKNVFSSPERKELSSSKFYIQ